MIGARDRPVSNEEVAQAPTLEWTPASRLKEGDELRSPKGRFKIIAVIPSSDSTRPDA